MDIENEGPGPLLPAVVNAAPIVLAEGVPMFDSEKFRYMLQLSRMMAAASMIPDTLKAPTPEGTLANCLLVVNTSVSLGVDPFQAAQCASLVYGKLVWEGKFIAALLEAKLKIRFKAEYSGEGDRLKITLTGRHPSDDHDEIVEGTVGEWLTRDKQGQVKDCWKPANAKRQLRYRAVREWGRLHAPAMVLGLYGDDEFNESDVIHQEARPAAPAERKISAGFGDAAPVVEAAKKQTPEELASTETGREVVGFNYDEASLEVLDRAQTAVKRAIRSDEIMKAGPDRGDKIGEGQILAILIDKGKPTEVAYLRNGGLVDTAGHETPPKRGPGRPRKTAGADPGNKKPAAANETAPPADNSPPPAHKPDDSGNAAGQKTDEDVAFDKFVGLLSEAQEWAEARVLFVNFQKGEPWKTMPEARKTFLRREVWFKAFAFNQVAGKSGDELPADPRLDPLAFRCAIDAVEDGDVLRGMWADFTGGPGWTSLSDQTKQVLQHVTMLRLEALAGGLPLGE